MAPLILDGHDRPVSASLADAHLLDQAGGAVHLAHHPQHVAHVDVDRARLDRVVDVIGGHGVVGGVEDEPDELALPVERYSRLNCDALASASGSGNG